MGTLLMFEDYLLAVDFPETAGRQRCYARALEWRGTGSTPAWCRDAGGIRRCSATLGCSLRAQAQPHLRASNIHTSTTIQHETVAQYVAELRALAARCAFAAASFDERVRDQFSA
jgi:hypothetical protein